MHRPLAGERRPRGAAYDRRFEDLAAAGVGRARRGGAGRLLRPGSVLDAGCGTGRVAIELSRRGHEVVGVDVDPAMLETARAKAPDLTWVQGDLTDPGLDLGRTFDVVVMAGNVLIFVPAGTEAEVIANAAALAGARGPPRRRLLPAAGRLRPGRARCPGRPRAASSSRTAGPPGTAALRARRRLRGGGAPQGAAERRSRAAADATEAAPPGPFVH